ncbi:hypothetical protein ACH5RR_003092 [Cinchona calisaya]|uniref:Reverse transcriptase domain-containing protein n=1 Tax=Cinchona calisaya TaxID=153742 RepID=A0ABD3ATU7_9GENT
MYYPLNRTILTLVPQVENASCMKDFRSIACCNVLYKCYSTVLSNRLKKIFPELISENQNAFIAGKHINDNVLLMHETVRNYHRIGGKARAVLKIDIMKAYDTLNWKFLFTVMRCMGFPET